MEGEESSSDNSIDFIPWEGLEEEARTESPDSQSDSESDEDCEIDEDCELDQEPEGTGAEEIGRLVNGDMCDLTKVWRKMRSIDMNNNEAVASLIRTMTSKRERERLEFIGKDEADIPAVSGALPDKVNSDGPSTPEKDRAVERFQAWHLELVTGSRVQYPIASSGQFLIIVVNARKESRLRLLQLLTDSNILPWDIQYIFGQDLWTSDIFDYLPHIDLPSPEDQSQPPLP